MPSRPPLHVIIDPDRADLVVAPLRRRILELARAPASASDVGKALGEPRQKVNYHLKLLAAAGLVRIVSRERRRGVTEIVYETSADAYLIAPTVLGALAPDPASDGDRGSPAHLLALTARTQNEVGRTLADGDGDGRRGPTLAIDLEMRFSTTAQRDAFHKALQETVLRLVEKHSAAPGPGARTQRVVLFSHPATKAE